MTIAADVLNCVRHRNNEQPTTKGGTPMKNYSALLTLILAAATAQSLGNGWSFEPAPRPPHPETDTNEVRQTLLPSTDRTKPITLRELGDVALATLLDERLRYGMRRFNPRQTMEYLSHESAAEWMEELRIRDGKKAVTDGLKLTGREYAVRTLGIGGFIGDLLGGKKIGTVRSSVFEASEGVAGWYQTRVPVSHFAWEGDPFRENPYMALVRKGKNWWNEPLWEVRARVAAEDWQHPRMEAGGTVYLKRNIALETGVQLRSEVERNGNSFGHGDDQRLAVFIGMNFETRWGNFSGGVSAFEVKRVFLAYECRW